MIKIKYPINYIISAYGGKRREEGLFCERHLSHLQTLKFNYISQITIGWPPYEPNHDFQKRLDFLKSVKKINNAVVRVMEMPLNLGCNPLWQYRKIIQSFPNFYYYIFMEDDYIPLQDNFDQKMLDIFKSKDNCGFLFPFINKHGPGIGDLGIVGNGIASRNSIIPLVEHGGFDSCWRNLRSVLFSLGFDIFDMTPHYSVPFWGKDLQNGKGYMHERFPTGGNPLLAPIQILDNNTIMHPEEYLKKLGKFNSSWAKDYLLRIKNKETFKF